MAVAYLIEFAVRSAERERFLKLLGGVLDTMRQEDSYIAATLHADPDDPLRFLLHEVWSDHDEVVAVQLHRPYRQDWHDALPDLLERERRIEVWRPI